MILSIPKGPFAAYLFDCDGTIADSLPLHYQAWQKAIEPWRCPFPQELFFAWGGIPVPKTVAMLNERFHLNMPIAEVTRRREEAYLALMASVRSHPEVESIIREIHGQIPLAVVSGSPRSSVESTLRQLNLLTFFELIITAEDCLHGKPHPEPYLTAAQKIGVMPEKCLVFEDAEPGIESARAAGMRFVRIPQHL